MVDVESLKTERVRPLRVEEYVRLFEAGAFEDERVELLRGVIVELPVQGEAHAWITARLGELLYGAVSRSFRVRQHSPFHADELSMPEPDITIVKRSSRIAHPTAASLLVEVSDSSLRKDRGIKRAIYADAGVPEYWIVDVASQSIEVLRRPRGGRGTTVRTAVRGETVRPVALRGVAIAVDDVFPPPRRARRARRPRKR